MDDEALFDDAPCAYLVLTPDGHITRANTAFRRWTGRDDPVGLDLRQALPPGARA
jgi:PAS domain-containing protein